MDNEEKKTVDIEEELQAEETETAEAEKPETENAAEEAGEAKEAASEEKAEPQEDLQLQYLRLAADFQNYRRRTEKEKSDIYAFANEKFATELLEVIDNFERAMAAKDPDADDKFDKFAEGMELILKQLKGVLDKNHITEIEAEGKPFDPNFHNAVLTEAAEDAESGTVTKVLQKGYQLNGKVIRPSMVAVAQ